MVVVLTIQSCQESDPTEINFYHWKSKAKYDESTDQVIKRLANQPKIYMHYFDVDIVQTNQTDNGQIFPVYLLKEVDVAYKAMEVVPVVYIANRIWANKPSIHDLSKKIIKLTNQISQQHFGLKHSTIHLDCDWTMSTRNQYFKLIELLNQKLDVIPTIRLHQVKYKDRTGVPPVKQSVLMLYNVGDLKDFEHNSILSVEVVEKYLNEDSSYPLKMKLALPLFSQTVIKNNDDEIRLVNHVDKTSLISAPGYFKEINPNVYQVLKDTLYHGYYLSQGYNLKLEKLETADILSSYEVFKSSQINFDEIIFYHLDSKVLAGTNIQSIINQL